jgi:hypothetical protein
LPPTGTAVLFAYYCACPFNTAAVFWFFEAIDRATVAIRYRRMRQKSQFKVLQFAPSKGRAKVKKLRPMITPRGAVDIRDRSIVSEFNNITFLLFKFK